MGSLHTYASLRFIGVLVLTGGLSACLERSLPVAPTKAPDSETQVTLQEVPADGPNHAEREAYIERLSNTLLKDSAGDSSLEELIRLLREMNQAPDDNALSMEELRTLQGLVLDSGGKIIEALRPAPARPTESLEEPDVFDLSNPSSCPAPTYEVKTLPSGLRLIAGLPRQDPCSLRLSKTYQDLLNRVLKKKHARFGLGGTEYSVTKLEELFSILEKRGFSIQIAYRTYLAPFVRLYQPTGDPYLPDTEIPLPLWLKPGIRTSDARDVVLPAPHSEIFFRVQASPTEAEAQFKIYFSDKGFVFDDEDLVLPNWSGLRVLEEIPSGDRPKLLRILTQLHQTFEIFKSHAPKSLPMGGFGLLGVCNDGSVLAMKALRGNDYIAPFPLVRSDRVKMPEEQYPLKKLWESSPSDTWKDARVPREIMVQRIERGNPFVGRTNPFVRFEVILRLLAEEASQP